MPPVSLRLPTPLGDLEFIAHVEGASNVDVGLRQSRFRPRLPPGLSVAGCHAVVLEVKSEQPIDAVRFQARRCEGVPATSDVEAGEVMEARTWWAETHVLSVGTEDWDALRLRLQDRWPITGDPIEHGPDGIEIRLGGVPANEAIGLHFVVAWNPLPEPQESSCWYAVDQPHARVVAALSDDGSSS